MENTALLKLRTLKTIQERIEVWSAVKISISNEFRMFWRVRYIGLKRRLSTESHLKVVNPTASLQLVGKVYNIFFEISPWFSAKFYNDLESRLYNFDKTTVSNMETIKIFLQGENQRIEEELLKMNKFELKMASSIMSKWMFLRNDQSQLLLMTVVLKTKVCLLFRLEISILLHQICKTSWNWTKKWYSCQCPCSHKYQTT